MNNWKKLLLSLCLCLAGCSSQPATQNTQKPVAQGPVAQSQINPAQNQPARLAAAPVETTASDASVQEVAATTGSTNAVRLVPAGQDNSNLLLGNPSKAGTDPNNYLVERPQHALAYNKANGGPNWVSWHLQKSDLGSIRRGNFWPDPLLLPAMQIRPNDYRGSGYDRGHVCPSGDRTSSKPDNDATFVMSNMLPQAAALNQHVWKNLEDYCRYLANGGNELYIVAGGSGSAERIAGGRVNVPTVCWKIIVVLPLGDNDLRRINANTRVIAVAIPNREMEEISQSKWAQWITSVAQLEKATGYDFLSALPDDIEKALEQKRDSGRAQRTARGSESDASQNDAPQSESQNGSRRTVARDASVGTGLGRTRSAKNLSAGQANNPAATSNQVWVNTNSGVYHFPGARWYGNTKEGAYMSEREALAQGYRAAENGQ